MSAKKFTPQDATQWYQAQDSSIFLADVLDASNSSSMSVGFARYGKGESNNWVVTYDETLIITRGKFSVITEEGTVTAGPGEVIFLTKDTALTYKAEEDTELVYVTYPHWAEAQSGSKHAPLMNNFHPVSPSQALKNHTEIPGQTE